MKIDAAEILQKLHESDFHYSIESTLKSGIKFTIWTEDGMIRRFSEIFKNFDEGIGWLGNKTKYLNSYSEFAAWWRSNNEN